MSLPLVPGVIFEQETDSLPGWFVVVKVHETRIDFAGVSLSVAPQ
jgi:hypothetical protein